MQLCNLLVSRVLSSILGRYPDYMVHLMKAFFCGYRNHHQFVLLFDNNGLLYVLFQIHMLKSTTIVQKKIRLFPHCKYHWFKKITILELSLPLNFKYHFMIMCTLQQFWKFAEYIIVTRLSDEGIHFQVIYKLSIPGNEFHTHLNTSFLNGYWLL